MIFGRRDTWAIEVEPISGGPEEADRAARATWSSLRLWVSGRNLFAHARTDAATFEDCLRWPAVHLARWFLAGWPGLWERAGCPVAGSVLDARRAIGRLDRHLVDNFDDADDSDIEVRDAFVESHAMGSAAAGGVMPAIYLLREDERMEVTWQNASEPSGLRFLEASGHASFSASHFIASLEEFLEWVRTLVVNVDAGLVREIEQWQGRLVSPDAAEAVMRGYAWPWAAKQPAADPPIDLDRYLSPPIGWRGRGARVEPSRVPAAVVFRALSPVVGPDDVKTLITKLLSFPKQTEGAKQLDALQRQLGPSSRGAAHSQGYALAEQVRSLLGNVDHAFDVEGALQKLGVAILDDELSDPRVDAATVWDDEHGPVIVVNSLADRTVRWARRMALAHEFCHLLIDRAAAAPLMIASSPWAPALLERRANAFAAELLLPKAGILRSLGNSIRIAGVDAAGRKQLMDEFQVGSTVCNHQLENRLKVSDGLSGAW